VTDQEELKGEDGQEKVIESEEKVETGGEKIQNETDEKAEEKSPEDK